MSESPLRIGIIDLDTSHPKSFLPIIRELGHEVVAVWDRGTVQDDGYAAEFAAQFDIAKVVPPQDMPGLVDAVYLNAVDWDRHVPTAQPFVEQGIPVLIDKPLAGSSGDLAQLRYWLRAGAVITGGSALRWCDEAVRARAELDIEFATIWCAGHPLDYGIHGHSLAVGLLGPDIDAVRHLGDSPWRMELRWRDGRSCQLVVAEPGHSVPFRALVLTPDGAREVVPELGNLYPSFLRAVLPRLGGSVPVESDRQTVVAEAAALADLASSRDGGAWISVDDLPDGVGFDGPGFAGGYRSRARGG